MRVIKITGYASIFNMPDISNDIVRPGAFLKSITRHDEATRENQRIKMLKSHDGDEIGFWTNIREKALGLWVEGVVDDEETISLIESRTLQGLSIGFLTKKSIAYFRGKPRPKNTQPAKIVRELFELDVREISVVYFGMHPLALIKKYEEIKNE